MSTSADKSEYALQLGQLKFGKVLFFPFQHGPNAFVVPNMRTGGDK